MASTVNCHRLIIQWHLSPTIRNLISVASFCSVCSMHGLRDEVTGATFSPPPFSNWHRAVFGAVKLATTVSWCVMDTYTEGLGAQKISN